MIRQFTLIVRPGIVSGFLLLYLALYACEHVGGSLFNGWFEWCGPIRIGLIFVSLVVYGLRRGALHPRSNPGYAGWLAMTPWRVGLPLPLGPAHLSWVDGVVVAALWGLGYWEIAMHPLTAVILFLLPCTIIMAANINTGELAGWVYLFTLPLIWWPQLDKRIAAAVLVGNYLLLWWTMRQDLKQFPWYGDAWKVDVQKLYRQAVRESDLITWPFNLVGPVDIDKPGAWWRRLLLVGLAGWWLQTVCLTLVRVTSELRKDEQLFWQYFSESCGDRGVWWYIILFVGVVLAWLRLHAYTREYKPPIGWLGRVFTGRLLIPGYDKVYAAPMLTVALAAMLPQWWWQWGWSGQWLPGPLLALWLCVLLLAGPSMLSWRLTGQHHVVPMKPKKNKSATGASKEVDLNSLEVNIKLYPSN